MSIKPDFSEPQAGQPANVSEGTQVQEPANTPLTRADILDVLQEYDRKAQSARDKMEARFNKQLNTVQAAMKAAGLDIQPDQMRQVEQIVRQQMATAGDASDEPPAQGGKQEPRQNGNAAIDPIDAYVNGLHEAYDFELDENDIEAAPVKQAKTEKEFKREYKKAMDLKAQRLEQEGKVSASNRLSGAGSGGMGADGLDALTAQLDEALKNPSQNKQKIVELRGRIKSLIQ